MGHGWIICQIAWVRRWCIWQVDRHSHRDTRTRYCSNVKLMVFLPFSVGAICPPSIPSISLSSIHKMLTLGCPGEPCACKRIQHGVSQMQGNNNHNKNKRPDDPYDDKRICLNALSCGNAICWCCRGESERGCTGVDAMGVFYSRFMWTCQVDGWWRVNAVVVKSRWSVVAVR